MRHSMLLIMLLFTSAVAVGQTGVVNSRHNMSTGGPGTIVAETEGAVCVFCHTPHTSNTAQTLAPLWNRSASAVSSYTLYSSDYLTSLSYPSPTQPNAKSKLCLSCHDGTIALGAVYNAPGASSSITMANSVTTMPTDAGGYVGTDLGNDHPVGFTFDPSSDPELVTRAWPWGTAVKLDPDASNGRLECHTCHDVHDNQYTNFLRMSNANAGLCTFCHSKTGWTGSSVVHRVSTQSYTPPGNSATTIGEWACRNCHTSHQAGTGGYLLAGTEEATCLQAACHGSSAPAATKDIASQYNKTYKHPTSSTGLHKNPEDATHMASNRHAECWDCHNPHEAEDGTHTVSSQTTISGVLKGVWGVEPTFGTTPINMTDNDNAFTTVTGYTVVDPATREYQICLKCHSSYLTGSHRNIAEELDKNYPSYHGIIPGGTTNTYCNSTTMVSPWGSSAANKVVWCSDCHGSDDTGTPPQGPHGSNADNLLVATAVSNSTVGTPLCDKCHSNSTYWSGSATGSRYSQHPSSKPAHQLPMGCFSCHMYDFNSNANYNNGNYGGNSLKIFVHGMNKRYYYAEFAQGSGKNKNILQSATQDYADAFVAGYLADVDFTNKQCWTEQSGNTEYGNNCGHGHSGQAY